MYTVSISDGPGKRDRAGRGRQSAGRGYRRGLQASVRNNASAYGFSVTTITASSGLLTSALSAPTAPKIFAFALVEFVVSWGTGKT